MSCTVCRNIETVRVRDDYEKAYAYAQQAVRAYRRAVLEKRGRIARRAMIEAYLCAKRYGTGRSTSTMGGPDGPIYAQ